MLNKRGTIFLRATDAVSLSSSWLLPRARRVNWGRRPFRQAVNSDVQFCQVTGALVSHALGREENGGL